MSDKEVAFSIIVGIHNGVPLVRDCLESIFKSDYQNYEVICVDSGSTDGTVEFINREFRDEPRLKVVGIKDNAGNAVAYNLGAATARNELMVFLDFDMTVDRRWLKELAVATTTNSSIGVWQAMVLDMRSRPDTIQCAGIYILDYSGWTWSSFKGTPYESFRNKFEDNLMDIGIAAGNALVMHRDLFEKVGKFDRTFFMYFEEVDLCWRVWLAGYKVALVPSAKIYHLGGDVRKYTVGYGLAKSLRTYHSQRNNFRTVIKNYELTNLLRFTPTIILTPILLRLYGLYKDADYYSFVATIKAAAWNLRHLKDTLNERNRIQRSLRTVPDDVVMSHISKRLPLSSMFSILEEKRLKLVQTPMYSRLKHNY